MPIADDFAEYPLDIVDEMYGRHHPKADPFAWILISRVDRAAGYFSKGPVSDRDAFDRMATKNESSANGPNDDSLSVTFSANYGQGEERWDTHDLTLPYRDA